MEYLDKLREIAPRLPETLFVLLAGLLVVPGVVYIAKQTMRRFRFSKALREMSVKLISYALYLLLLIGVLYSFGLTGIAATLSGSVLVVGVAVSQAFKDLLSDLIAGFSIARDSDFEIGYTMEIGAKNKGVIKTVGSRKVRLIDKDGYTVILPNSMVEKSEWRVIDRESTLKNTKQKT